MKTLLLLRHAKSDWQADYETDHERPLSPRGRKAASLMGRFITAVELLPDLAISSSAVRARETLEIAAEAGGWGRKTGAEDILYSADAKGIVQFLSELDVSASRVLIVGHNPSMEEVISILAGGGAYRCPTATLTSLELPISQWQQVSPGLGTVRLLVTPKAIKKALAYLA